MTCLSTDEVQEANAVRWKVEFHRGVKQLTGIEACQCRKARIQRNHIACDFGLKFKRLSILTSQTIYQLKYQWLSEYLIEELKHLYSHAACLTYSISSVFA